MEDPGWYDSQFSILQFLVLIPSAEASRIEARIAEGEAKRYKRDNLEFLLSKKDCLRPVLYVGIRTQLSDKR